MQVNLQSGQLYEEALLLLAEIQNTLNQDNSYQNSHILESITVIEQKLDQALENLSSIDQRTQIRFFIFEFYLNFRVSYLFSLEKIIFVWRFYKRNKLSQKSKKTSSHKIEKRVPKNTSKLFSSLKPLKLHLSKATQKHQQLPLNLKAHFKLVPRHQKHRIKFILVKVQLLDYLLFGSKISRTWVNINTYWSTFECSITVTNHMFLCRKSDNSRRIPTTSGKTPKGCRRRCSQCWGARYNMPLLFFIRNSKENYDLQLR